MSESGNEALWEASSRIRRAKESVENDWAWLAYHQDCLRRQKHISQILIAHHTDEIRKLEKKLGITGDPEEAA